MPRLLCVVALASGLLAATVAARADDARYHEAHAQYEIGHFREAFAGFSQLADEGHCEAARIARQMVRYGTALYPAPFHAEPERLARWQRLVDCPSPRDLVQR
jgi:hypothetical protein